MRFTLSWVICLSWPAAGNEGDALKPGDLTAEPSTVTCVGVRWAVAGDANRNATGALAYRIGARGDWREALPLFRVMPEHVADGHPVPEMFAGSVFGLPPDTDVELRARLSDPDGGRAEKTLRIRTRPVPRASKNGRRLFAVPGNGGGDGTPANPWRGLHAIDPRPGDIVTLRKGTYRGPWTIRAGGAPGEPVVFRGEEAVLEGGEPIVSIHGSSWLHFENLIFRGGEKALVGHGASEIVVRRCRFEGSRHGITAVRSDRPISNWYVADNVLEGPCSWPRSKGIEDVEGIQLMGSGHVVCHNRIRGFADAISIFGTPTTAIDFYGNDISECTDDGIELDYGGANIRSFQNRLTNCFAGISAQPVYGGPCYIVRNVIYNTEYTPLKLHNGPSGLIILHNTSVRAGVALSVYGDRPVANAVFRNNLFLGTGDQLADWMCGAVACDFDYNGWGVGSGLWKIGNVRKHKLAEVEPHGFLVGDAGLEIPKDFKTRYEPPDLIPHARIPKGVALPNINEGRTDLGAVPSSGPVPHYGPRPDGVDEATPNRGKR